MVKSASRLSERYQLLLVMAFLVLVVVIEYQWWRSKLPVSAFMIGMSQPLSYSYRAQPSDGVPLIDSDPLTPALQTRVIQTPDVWLVNHQANPVFLPELLAHSGPVVVQFIFTSCKTVCPVMVTTFSQSQALISEVNAKLISISIDPVFDTPERLSAYSQRYGADTGWQFLTGDGHAISSVTRAFNAVSAGGNKMNHTPRLYIRPGLENQWYETDALAGLEAFHSTFTQLVSSQ